MNRKDVRGSERNTQPEENPTPKRPYQAPNFRFERVFASLMGCGKIHDTQESCVTAQPKIS